ncbi:MAG TPA: hypothetical protein PKC84_10735 [Paracoccaceae bacterium]|nr:hypothetical protein [Paracoccaceae bacterium]
MTLHYVLLAAQAVVFVVWAFVAFRILFRLRARAGAETGLPFPGVGATLRSLAGFLRRPEDRADRRRLSVLTLALFGLTAGIAVLASG